MTLECKCHGVSGSCNIRTCWLAIGDFRQTGDYLRKKYNSATQVVMNRYGTGFTIAHRKFRKPTKNDLVYFEDSPDYCIWDHESGEQWWLRIEYCTYCMSCNYTPSALYCVWKLQKKIKVEEQPEFVSQYHTPLLVLVYSFTSCATLLAICKALVLPLNSLRT